MIPQFDLQAIKYRKAAIKNAVTTMLSRATTMYIDLIIVFYKVSPGLVQAAVRKVNRHAKMLQGNVSRDRRVSCGRGTPRKKNDRKRRHGRVRSRRRGRS